MGGGKFGVLFWMVNEFVTFPLFAKKLFYATTFTLSHIQQVIMSYKLNIQLHNALAFDILFDQIIEQVGYCILLSFPMS